MHWVNTKTSTLMYHHSYIQSNTPSQIREHSYISPIFPFVFLWDTIQVLVQQGLPNWCDLFICSSVINPKKLCYLLNQKRLSKLKRRAIKLSLSQHRAIYLSNLHLAKQSSHHPCEETESICQCNWTCLQR